MTPPEQFSDTVGCCGPWDGGPPSWHIACRGVNATFVVRPAISCEIRRNSEPIVRMCRFYAPPIVERPEGSAAPPFTRHADTWRDFQPRRQAGTLRDTTFVANRAG
jgi:hypothetical protein